MKKGILVKRVKLIATVGTITVKSFDVKGYRTLTAEFESAVPAASQAKVIVKRGSSTVALTTNWNKEGTSVDFVNDRALPEGEYVLSVDDKDTDKKVTVGSEKVGSITIEGKDKERVLTGTSSASKQEGRSNDEAYIYYDVKNQYGESIRHRVTVNWSITSCDTNKEKSDSVLGLVVAQRKNDRETFVYDTPLHVTATCIMGKEKLSQSFDLKIGAIQTVDDVKLAGFVKENYKARDLKDKKISEIKKTLDADFTKETHSLLYQTFDQNGNQMAASNNYLGSNTENAKLVLRSEKTDVVRDAIRDGGVYTLTKPDSPDAPEYSKYSSATIEPGRYIDRDNSIKFTWLTTGTGGQGSEEFTIDGTKRLQSFNIEPLSDTVADGDTKELNFTAIATDGSVITDYKTIARSSNYLTFAASAGELKLEENNDGTAKLTWADDAKYRINGLYTDYNPYKNPEIVIDDGVDRTVSLTASVEGGETYTRLMSVRDMRHPYSVLDVKHGGIEDDMLVEEGLSTINVKSIDYYDQYGKKLEDSPKNMFWDAEIVKTNYNNNDYQYGIRVKGSNGSSDYYGTDLNGIRYNNWVSWAENGVGKHSCTYSVIKRDEVSLGDNNSNYLNPTGRWYELGAARNETYTVVPFNMLSDFDVEIADNGNGLTLGIETALSQYDNGTFNVSNSGETNINYGNYNPSGAVSAAAVGSDGKGCADSDGNLLIKTTKKGMDEGLNTIKVVSKYKGVKLEVPFDYYMATTEKGPWTLKNNGTREIVTGSGILVEDNKITAIKQGYLSWKDLYNVNDARYTRKTTELKLQLFVGKDVKDVKTGKETVNYLVDKDGILLEKRIKISDQRPGISRIVARDETALSSVRPEDARVNASSLAGEAYVLDQYGQYYDLKDDSNNRLIYSISGYEESNDGRYTGNHEITDNGTNNTIITGVERGDSYYVTFEVSNNIVPALRVKVTAGADKKANIVSNKGIVETDEYEYRYNHLGYNR